MTALANIETLTKEHAADRAVLADRVRMLQEEIEAAKRRRLPGIKAAVGRARDSRVRLLAAIEENKAEFSKPRTRVFHGIKVGLQKAKGKLQFACSDKVVELIKKHFADQADVLIKTTETPVRNALQQLAAADLKKLGCSITDTSDKVVIEPINTEIDELVDALLKDENDDKVDEDAA